jgi:peptidyl-tRNA hydrolase, PTH1 family
VKVIVGLGNPGEKYFGTRHNLGFMVLDEYAQKHLDANLSWDNNSKVQGEVIKISDEVMLVKPNTFMNNSGLCVKNILNFYKLDPQDLIVVYDELDLPLGQIKIRLGGAAAGHHGVESIINTINNDKFLRIRLGIGNRHTIEGEHGKHHLEADKYVIDTFPRGEKSKVKHMLKQSVKALDLLLDKGYEAAQNQFN